MSRLFKIIIKLIVKNNNDEVFLIQGENSIFFLPNFEVDFNSKNIEGFLLTKFNLTNDKYKIASDIIRKRELFGELIYVVKINSENLNISNLFTNKGVFINLNKTQQIPFNNEDRELLK